MDGWVFGFFSFFLAFGFWLLAFGFWGSWGRAIGRGEVRWEEREINIFLNLSKPVLGIQMLVCEIILCV